MEKNEMKNQEMENNKISRRDAIKKTGKMGAYASLTAASMMIILNPQNAPATSKAPESMDDPGTTWE